MTDNVQRHTGEPGKANYAPCAGAEVDDSALYERTAIVDPHCHGAAVTLVGHPHHGAERQGAMGRGQR